MADSANDFYDRPNTYGVCEPHLSKPARQPELSKCNTIKTQYPDEGRFASRVQEERGVIVNFASVVTDFQSYSDISPSSFNNKQVFTLRLGLRIIPIQVRAGGSDIFVGRSCLSPALNVDKA